MENDEHKEEELDLELDINEEELETEDDNVTISKKELQTLKAQREHWREKANKKDEPVKQETPKPVEDKSATPPDDIKQTVQELALAEKKRQFGYSHGLSPEETDAVFRLNPNPTKETLDDPFVKGGLANIRSKKKVEEATPSSKRRSFSLTSKEFKELPKEEQNASYQEHLKELVKQKRG